ncbi:MAG: hypothetical protein QHH17_03315 [Candidatus Bathyarchaeota archaeon]|nr:hypothetical protein [Candidatus Bathyarchaeota archaeon]
MGALWIEVNCGNHGFERFRIKIVKKFNIPSDMIIPKFRSRPKPGELSCLLVGRDVSLQEIEHYMDKYFRQKGLWGSILRIKWEI